MLTALACDIIVAINNGVFLTFDLHGTSPDPKGSEGHVVRPPLLGYAVVDGGQVRGLKLVIATPAHEPGALVATNNDDGLLFKPHGTSHHQVGPEGQVVALKTEGRSVDEAHGLNSPHTMLAPAHDKPVDTTKCGRVLPDPHDTPHRKCRTLRTQAMDLLVEKVWFMGDSPENRPPRTRCCP